MAKEKSLLVTYMNATVGKRVDLLMDHYADFMGVVEGHTEGIRYRIQAEKDFKRRSEMGDLGVRVQGGGIKSDPTANAAIRNIVTRDAIINCDFFGDMFEDIDGLDIFIREAYLLRQMRMDYELLSSQLGVLGKYKKDFTQYLSGDLNIVDLTSEWGISYEAAKTKAKRLRKQLKEQMLCFMDESLGGIA